MALRKLSLYYHTIKYLKFKQIIFRLWYRLIKPSVSEKVDYLKINTYREATDSLFLYKRHRYFNNRQACFLNHCVDISSSAIWNDKNQAKLWLYNLHYFDSLNAQNLHHRALSYQLLERWQKENPISKRGNGWEPYPISLRIVNIIKYVLLGGSVSEKIKYSLYVQARYLNKICEYHILGNHLFENFKALCFAGLFFESKEASLWLKKGSNGLKKEIKEQVLADGGHFELSAMYHSIILEGLLDLKAIFDLYGRSDLFLWSNQINQMLSWLDLMRRNDDSISYFNDAADQIAQAPRSLFDYAKRLGFEYQSSPKTGLTILDATGYTVYNFSRIKAILDTADIGASYLPGHAHADNLSFELIIDGFPVFVNLGTSCYGDSQRRYFERSTKAHNTLVMADHNSSEIWGSFRVARRATTQIIERNSQGGVCHITAMHNGYQRLENKAIHRRQWQFRSGELLITDQLETSQKAQLLLHLHPLCQITETTSQGITITLPNQKDIMLKFSGVYKIQDSQYALTFGTLQPTKTFSYQLDNQTHKASIMIRWDDQ
ncbi:alginate lyase family protein [bacterium SCSIO 12844]|nr:alginate lyase family protein [bacterium SCSIO 12844]